MCRSNVIWRFPHFLILNDSCTENVVVTNMYITGFMLDYVNPINSNKKIVKREKSDELPFWNGLEF